MNNVIFTICGNPTLDTTKEIIETSHADVIILGIPFSDPIAEAPDIQTDSTRALKNGATLKHIFEMIEKSNSYSKLIFKTYANVIYSYGAKRFMEQCQSLNIKGIIIPDLPFEEREEFNDICHQYNITLISVVASNTPNRVQRIVEKARDFIYISTRPQDDLSPVLNKLKQFTNLPYIIDKDCKYQ